MEAEIKKYELKSKLLFRAFVKIQIISFIALALTCVLGAYFTEIGVHWGFFGLIIGYSIFVVFIVRLHNKWCDKILEN